MNSVTLAGAGRLRHFWVEGVLATALTLSVVTAAYATTALSSYIAKPEPTYAKVEAQVAPAPPPEPPPPEFAFGEPVPGYSVNSPFGLRRMPWERHGRLHEGVDIAAPSGKPVVAVADGVITKAGRSPSYGRYVEVRHGEDLVSFYAHLGRIDPRAKAGVAVSAGTMIGKIGSSGTSTGPHLHFEMRQKDRPLNPVSFMDREFATAQDLPLKAAAYYPKRVRVAQVSNIPPSKRDAGGERRAKDGRVVATLEVASATTD